MTTVAELIARLQTLDQDAEVEVLTEIRKSWDVTTTYAPVDASKGICYITSYDGEQYRNSKLFGRKFVFLEAE
jgi:monomeric isocitrate dehydrogenase